MRRKVTFAARNILGRRTSKLLVEIKIRDRYVYIPASLVNFFFLNNIFPRFHQVFRLSINDVVFISCRDRIAVYRYQRLVFSISHRVLSCWVTRKIRCFENSKNVVASRSATPLSLIHIWRCRRSTLCRSRWSPYH